MGRTKHGKRDIRLYNIRGTNKMVQAGDCILLRPSDKNSPPYVARVLKIEADNSNNVRFWVRWYYRPEESVVGRQEWHGAKELFLSDHYDTQSAQTVEGKCTVHNFENYTELENVTAEDYYCRYEYRASSGVLLSNNLEVYCNCEKPYNPDKLMIQCEECEDWFHPGCVNMTTEQVKQLDRFVCSQHTNNKALHAPYANRKECPKRQKK